jgi:hypothetical protein
MDLVSCDLTGIMENCTFVACNIKNARIYKGKFIRSNKISESYLNGVSLNKSNEINKCYVINNEEIINCEVNESVIKFATPGKNLKIDEKSTLIVKEEKLPGISGAIKIDEIRDYSFIKNMSKTIDDGFANIYKKEKYVK